MPDTYTPAAMIRWLDGLPMEAAENHQSVVSWADSDTDMARQIKALIATDPASAATRHRADADTLATAVERLAELQDACAALHAWAEANSLGHLPELRALIARLSAVLNT